MLTEFSVAPAWWLQLIVCQHCQQPNAHAACALTRTLAHRHDGAYAPKHVVAARSVTPARAHAAKPLQRTQQASHFLYEGPELKRPNFWRVWALAYHEDIKICR